MNCFGELEFQNGWKGEDKITIWGKEYSIVVKFSAYYEKDEITENQTESATRFIKNKKEVLQNIEKMLTENNASMSKEEYIPSMLLFERDGSYGLTFDEKNGAEDGFIILCEPKYEVIDLEEYL